MDKEVTIFSYAGEKVYTFSNKTNPSEKLSLNVANLAKGMYLCQLKIGETATTWKFIKK